MLFRSGSCRSCCSGRPCCSVGSRRPGRSCCPCCSVGSCCPCCSHRAFISLASFRTLRTDRAGYSLDTLGAGHTLRPHGTGRTRGANCARNTSRTLRADISFRALTARISFRAHVAANALYTLYPLRTRIASRTCAASWTGISRRAHRTRISSGCTGQQKLDTLIVFFYIQSAITVQTHMFPCTVLVLNIPVSMQAVPR